MGNPPGPLRLKARELLADGEWHLRRPVEAVLMQMVLDQNRSQAIRVAERDRVRQLRLADGERPPPRTRNEDWQVRARIGAGIMVGWLLRSRVDFETKKDGEGQDWIRLGERSRRALVARSD